MTTTTTTMAPRQTLLLCFIHGFKGGDDTFGNFPEHLRTLVSHALPDVTISAITYPKFETRGDLAECVGRFQEWLQNKVIDLEVAAATPSPTIEPSVHTILIGHSMGGIVAAETLLAIISDTPIPIAPDPSQSLLDAIDEPPTFIFPHIGGIIAFDTPYLGISPGVIAHGAETHYKAATSAWSTVSGVASALGYGDAAGRASRGNNKSDHAHSSSADGSGNAQQNKLITQGADAMSASMSSSARDDAAATPTWQRWGKYAMFAGAAGAVAAGGAAAYLKRDAIGEGWGWISSHLEFVGCLAKGEELRTRLDRVTKLQQSNKVGFRNLITVLGKGAGVTPPSQPSLSSEYSTFNPSDRKENNSNSSSSSQSLTQPAHSHRTFCNLPSTSSTKLPLFEFALNDRASSETDAHMEMFDRKRNPGYFILANRARDILVEWVGEADWHHSTAVYSSDDYRGDDRAISEKSEHTSQYPDKDTHDFDHKENEKGDEDIDADGDGTMVDIDLHDHNDHPHQREHSSSSALAITDEESNVWAGEAPVIIDK